MPSQLKPKRIPRSLRIEALLLGALQECSRHLSERKSRPHYPNFLDEEVFDDSKSDDLYLYEESGEAEEYDPGQDKSLDDDLEENHRTRSNRTSLLPEKKSCPTNEPVDDHDRQYRCKCFVKFAVCLGASLEDESQDEDPEEDYQARFSPDLEKESSDQEDH